MAANSFELVTKYLPLLDEVFVTSSITGRMDVPAKNVEFVGANAVKYFKTSMDGLANYDRDVGFVGGGVVGTWETLTLSLMRGRQFEIDQHDNEETLMLAFGTLAGEFIRTHVVPEVDAVRFARYASKEDILTTSGATLDSSNVVTAIDAAIYAMDEQDVPSEGRKLFITPTLYQAMKQSAAFTRFVTGNNIDRNFEMFDGMEVIRVPQTRFYTKIELYDGITEGPPDERSGGYAKDVDNGGVDINFMIIHPSSVLQITKSASPRIIPPESNKQRRAYCFDYLLYHDAFVYDNKVKGIYLHKNVS